MFFDVLVVLVLGSFIDEGVLVGCMLLVDFVMWLMVVFV